MAAAEARALWQRAASRCFVQEDAKRAPKLACCQSSTSSSKQVDGGSIGAADMTDHPAMGSMPLNRNLSFSNLPPDTRWWLQLQPSYDYLKGLTSEQLNAFEAELENLRAGSLGLPTKICDSRADSRCFDGININDSSCDVDTDPIGCPKMQKENEECFDPESPWIGGEKKLPWWRTDKDDLASLVAQRSLECIENFGLPPSQKMHIRRYPSTHSGSSDHDSSLLSSLDWKAQTGYVSNPIVHAQGCPNSESMGGIERASVEGNSESSSGNSFGYSTTHKDIKRMGPVSEEDPCKAQLLEALRHSQTRAREAEKAAKEACAEKEHLVKLFFRQASQLFAYKQWFRMLQLEALYHQMKNSDQTMSTLFPVVLPWMPQKGKRLRKNWQKLAKGKRGKRRQPRHDIGKYAVAFALGLSLVGAGLLLGWTVGWMLPL